MSEDDKKPQQGGEAGRRKAGRGIEKVFVQGFKSLAGPHTAEIRPLTLLAGANSSGKSSLMQPLLLLKQTLDATYDPGPLLLDGPHVQFNGVHQLLTSSPERRSTSLKVGLGISRSTTTSVEFKPDSQDALAVDSTRFVFGNGTSISLRPGMTSAELKAAVKGLKGRGEAESAVEVLTVAEEASEGGEVRLGVVRNRCFLGIEVESPALSIELLERPDVLVRQLRRMIHVPGLRGNPERTYRTTAVGGAFPGTFETYVASIIASWQREEAEMLQHLGEVLERLGLTSRVQARKLDASRVELQVGRLAHGGQGDADDLVNVADVGFGVSQVLPVLVALLQAEPGQLVYLEQPELHLHPRAQVAVASVLAEAARRGVRVVAETHSALLLLAIQALVAEGELDPSLVLLHWFRRDEGGLTDITTSELDESGAYGDWPEDFAEVELQAQKRYLDAVGKR